MRGRFEATQPEKAQYTMQLTMSLEEWIKLKDQLSTDAWPGSDLCWTINDMVSQAHRTYFPKSKEDA